MRVVGKEGALRAGVGGNCSSGMDGSKTISITKHGKKRNTCGIKGKLSDHYTLKTPAITAAHILHKQT